MYAADIGNAYLEAKTKAKLYFVAGSEFGELAGHTLVINKALYGLNSSGLRYHERFADTLRDMVYVPSKINDVWMKQNGDVWEYIAVYVHDLAIVAKDASAVIKTLREKYGYKIKGDGPMDNHLGATISRDKDGTLIYSATHYIEKILDSYNRQYGELPKNQNAPLEH